MGVEESKAYALAAAAMAGNEEEFARVAKECFENMDDNAAKAAYNMAHSIFVNASNSCNSISEIAAQAHETAQAIAAMGSGEVAGKAAPVSLVEQTEPKQAVSVLTCTKAISRGRIITMKQRLLAWTIMCHSLN